MGIAKRSVKHPIYLRDSLKTYLRQAYVPARQMEGTEQAT